MANIIGIDLGTTNSCVAFIEGGEPVVIPGPDGSRTTPSVVAFTKNGERLVGSAAKRQAVTNAARTVSSIKREMGSSYRVKIDNRQYTPQEISAMILQKLKTDAESYIGAPVTDAVITVPAYFTDAQRQATKDAGQIAGLNVLRIINEPTAAALAYGLDKQGSQKVMVYDLGGGTFDVSILEISSEVIEVLATAGNNRLGGDDFDQCLVDELVERFKREHKVDLRRDPVAMQRVREAAEKAKIELSGVPSATIHLPFLASGREGPLHMETTITRARFDELTAHLVQATMGPVRQAMQDSGLTPADLGRVLLVGGSSRIPAVQEAVRRFTGKDPFKGINPDECVAMGAAIQGGVLGGDVKSLLLLDVTPLSLGIETLGNMFSRIIDRTTAIPVQRSEIYTTAANFQTSVEVHVLQGEREMASANKSLAKFRLSGIRPAMRGVPQIEVTFAIDANGIVHVTARDLGTGKQQQIVITGSSNMSQAEIDRAMEDARRYAIEDKRRREEAEADNRLDHLLYRAESARKRLSREDQGRLQAPLHAAQKARRGKDAAEKLRTADALEETLNALGVSERDDGAPPEGTAENGAAGDGAQDAEFTPRSREE